MHQNKTLFGEHESGKKRKQLRRKRIDTLWIVRFEERRGSHLMCDVNAESKRLICGRDALCIKLWLKMCSI